MYKMKIDVEKIGAVIGSGGKTIRAITEQTKATIDIEDDGTVIIGSSDEASAKRAIEIVEGLTKELKSARYIPVKLHAYYHSALFMKSCRVKKA